MKSVIYEPCMEELKKKIHLLIEENKKLTEENEGLKRKIFGLETTVSNYREKEQAQYNDFGWSK